MPGKRVPEGVELPPFQTLLDTHARDVHRFLVASVGHVDADDCYQETWVSALRAYPRLRSAQNLRSWLFTIANHKALDHHRARARRPMPVAEIPEQPDVPGGDSDFEFAVAELPPKQRTAVALRYILDAGYPEIATMMNISEAAARRNVHEGLKRLRHDLTP
ncbi:MAG: RNA polymerase sigma factor [Solirubrobacterales bacterium]|nr:RNA polymerase sigma factor [Solirubrobacterales bacterium]